MTDEDVEHLCFSYWGGEDSVPVFKDLSSEEVAEAKIASGDIDVEDAPDVNIPSAIADYQNYGYGPLNTALRNGEQPEGRAAVIDAGLQQGFDSQKPTVMPMTLLRDSGTAVTAEAFEATGLDKYLAQNLHTRSLKEAWYDAEIRNEIREKLIGYEFTEKGYTSTTSSSEFFQEFSEGNGSQDMIMTTGAKETMCITVPKGTKVLDLGEDGYISGSGENEVILNKGAKYTITDVIYDSGTQSLMLFCNYSNENADANDVSTILNNSENPIDKSAFSYTIKSTGTSEDGGPGSGNHGHKGVPGKKGGSLPAVSTDVLKEAISSGKVSTKLDRSGQSKHTKGSKKYNDAVAKGDYVSYMSIGDDEVQQIISSKAGTGQAYSNGSQFKETIDAGKTVGVYLTARGEEKETTRLTIHYGSKGSHAVPASPKKG